MLQRLAADKTQIVSQEKNTLYIKSLALAWTEYIGKYSRTLTQHFFS